MKIKKYVIFPIIFLFLVSFVFAGIGVSHPPAKLQIKLGESGRFEYGIQTMTIDGDVKCGASADKNTPLIIEFDSDNIIIAPGTVKIFYGTVNVPSDTALGEYVETFCVWCGPVIQEEVGGASTVSERQCGIPIRVDVVSERTAENYYSPEKPMPAKPQYNVAVVVLILILLLVAIMFYVLKQPIRKSLKKK